jgi:hypothetical protein
MTKADRPLSSTTRMFKPVFLPHTTVTDRLSLLSFLRLFFFTPLFYCCPNIYTLLRTHRCMYILYTYVCAHIHTHVHVYMHIHIHVHEHVLFLWVWA